MNDLVEQTPNLFVAVFILLILLVIILAGIALRQRRKITDLTTPRYGFLGKPVSIVVASMMLGLVGFTLYLGIPPAQPEGISVSDDTELSLNISYTLIDQDDQIYVFNATPLLDDVPWGRSNEHIFSIEWKITKDSQYSFTKRQDNVNQETYRGLLESLETGKYVINATVVFNNLVAEDELTINIE
jgi:hypothetical protein